MKTFLTKLRTSEFPNPVYWLEDINLNQLIGQQLKLEFTGQIQCINCHRSLKKTFSQGYCFVCSQKLAACDLCILRPEKCHFHQGTCREPDWGREHCLIPHTIYLANSAGLKVGITRRHQREVRWVDQGAIQAVEIGTTSERLIAGQVEVELKKYFNDRADWRKLITGKDSDLDLLQQFEQHRLLLANISGFLIAENPVVQKIAYPVMSYLNKANSFNEAKTPVLEGQLKGIRGQYLLVGETAINMRKYQGYELSLEF